MTAITERNTVAWYWEGLGLGRPAGLHWRQTDRPQGTVTPHRTHLSYRRLMGEFYSRQRRGNTGGPSGPITRGSLAGDRRLREAHQGARTRSELANRSSMRQLTVGIGGKRHNQTLGEDCLPSRAHPSSVLQSGVRRFEAT